MRKRRETRKGRPGGRTRKDDRARKDERSRPGEGPRRKRKPAGDAPRPGGRPPRPRRPAPPASEPVTPDRLGGMLGRYGFKLSKVQLEQLSVYHAFLLDRNRTLNLTRILNLEDMVLKHYVDCFLVARHLPSLPAPLLDIGSGAGFPGIPLKILFPDLHIILGEGVRKRVNFLREARAEVGLEKLDIIGRNIDRDFEYPVNGVITRAVEVIPETLKRASNCLMPGGLAIFMKGPRVDDEMTMAEKKQGKLFTLADDIAYALPGTTQRRRLVIYKKLPREE